MALTLDQLAAKLDAHEHHHASDLNDFLHEPCRPGGSSVRLPGFERHFRDDADLIRARSAYPSGAARPPSTWESVPDHSLGALVSFQVVDHLSFEDVLALAHLAAVKLMPQVNAAFAQLNHHPYGPQDYAVVARASAASR